MCRASFPDNDVFEQVLPVLNVALASLHPLTDEQMFRALNAGSVKGELEWNDFQQRLDSLAGFTVRPLMLLHGRIYNGSAFVWIESGVYGLNSVVQIIWRVFIYCEDLIIENFARLT